jgi:hypothetical protein
MTGDELIDKRNPDVTFRTRRLPTVSPEPRRSGRETMSTTTTERPVEQTTWVCDNCHVVTAAVRKRCRECGTSRY